MPEYHSAKAFAREEPRIELIQSMLESLLAVVDLEFEGQPVKVDGFRLHDLEDWRTAREASLQDNLGSLSTACNCKCAFCYEEGNPKGLFEKEPKFVSVDEAVTRRRYLHDGRGLFRESKGFFEPLANPNFLTLLEVIREHDPEQVIDVTTNGALLTAEMVSRLADLRPIYVNVSLISANESTRRGIMGDRRAGSAIRAIEALQANEVPFMGTLVPLPEQGLQDIGETIEYLDSLEARIMRVALPALTRHHPRYEPGALEAWLPKVVEFVSELRTRLQTPVIISPYTYVTTSLDAIIEGVIKRSPAAAAGIRLGDRLMTIDGSQVVSRAHAASLLKKAARNGVVDVEVERAGTAIKSRLSELPVDAGAYPYKPRGYQPLNFPGMSFGLCLPGAFHLQYVKQIHTAIHERNAKNTLIVVSPFYRDLVADLLAELPLPEGGGLELLVPTNEFFGGNVTVGDLWVLEDIARAVRSHVERGEKPDLLVLPSSFLSHWGRDLRGVPYTELETMLDIEIALVQCERIML
jgi:hypothetical protein